MIRLILIVAVLVLTLTGGLAVALYQFYGWKGLIVLPLILLVFVWVAKKIIGMVIKKFALGLFGMKSGALKGATMSVHSITPVEKPPQRQPDPDEDDEGEEGDPSDGADDEEEEDMPDLEEIEGPRHYYRVDMTITPQAGNDERAWEPSEFILTTEKISSLEDMEEKEAGSVHDVQVWDGNAFGPDDPGKYPGQQRLLVTFAVKPGTGSGWVQYYDQSLGQLQMPEWQVASGSATAETGI